jgi:hypothetical protein
MFTLRFWTRKLDEKQTRNDVPTQFPFTTRLLTSVGVCFRLREPDCTREGRLQRNADENDIRTSDNRSLETAGVGRIRSKPKKRMFCAPFQIKFQINDWNVNQCRLNFWGGWKLTKLWDMLVVAEKLSLSLTRISPPSTEAISASHCTLTFGEKMGEYWHCLLCVQLVL